MPDSSGFSSTQWLTKDFLLTFKLVRTVASSDDKNDEEFSLSSSQLQSSESLADTHYHAIQSLARATLISTGVSLPIISRTKVRP